MPRAIWKGAISFGLVAIPVELHVAVRDHRPRFRLLHSQDQSPVHYERVCEAEGQPVAWEDLVKGYEYERGQFIVLTKDDFRTAALEKSRTIDILDFVDPAEIDDRYFETAYYLTPDRGGDRAYALLREAIRDSGKAAVAKIILREAQRLAAIEAIGDALVLTMMRYSDELVDASEFKFPSAPEGRGRELEMAKALVANLTGPWQPGKYTDEYQANLMRVIAAKLKGKKPALEGAVEPRHAQVVDLMERLRRSLRQRGRKALAAERPPRPPRCTARASTKSRKAKTRRRAA